MCRTALFCDSLYLVRTNPRWVAWRLSLVSKEMRSFCLATMWQTQSIDTAKAEYLLRHPHLSQLIRSEHPLTERDRVSLPVSSPSYTLLPLRSASFPPSELLGLVSPSWRDQDRERFPNLLRDLSGVHHVTLPYPDELDMRVALGAASSLSCLRLTHVQADPEVISSLANVCPRLEDLHFSIYAVNVRLSLATPFILKCYSAQPH